VESRERDSNRELKMQSRPLSRSEETSRPNDPGHLEGSRILEGVKFLRPGEALTSDVRGSTSTRTDFKEGDKQQGVHLEGFNQLEGVQFLRAEEAGGSSGLDKNFEPELERSDQHEREFTEQHRQERGEDEEEDIEEGEEEGEDEGEVQHSLKNERMPLGSEEELNIKRDIKTNSPSLNPLEAHPQSVKTKRGAKKGRANRRVPKRAATATAGKVVVRELEGGDVQPAKLITKGKAEASMEPLKEPNPLDINANWTEAEEPYHPELIGDNRSERGRIEKERKAGLDVDPYSETYHGMMGIGRKGGADAQEAIHH